MACAPTAKKCVRPLPVDPRLIDQPQIGLVNQGRRLQSVSLGFLPQIGIGQLAKFVVHQRHQFLGRAAIPRGELVDDPGCLFGWRGGHSDGPVARRGAVLPAIASSKPRLYFIRPAGGPISAGQRLASGCHGRLGQHCGMPDNRTGEARGTPISSCDAGRAAFPRNLCGLQAWMSRYPVSPVRQEPSKQPP